WRSAGVVVAFPALRLALHRAGAGRNRRDFLLRNDFAGILREGSLARLRAFQANERGHAAKTTSGAPEVNEPDKPEIANVFESWISLGGTKVSTISPSCISLTCDRRLL